MFTLSKEMLDAGRLVIEDLDKRGEEVDAALWFLFDDPRSWKLMLSLPKASRKGPREAYKVIQKSMKKLGVTAFGLETIAVARLDAPLIRLLRSAIKTGKAIGSIRFTSNVINGVSIEDAYIYRFM